MSMQRDEPIIPSKLYADSIRAQGNFRPPIRIASANLPLGRFVSLAPSSAAAVNAGYANQGTVRLVSESLPIDDFGSGDGVAEAQPPVLKNPTVGDPNQEVVTNLGTDGQVHGEIPGVRSYRRRSAEYPQYVSPLSLGDPGTSSSLWKESRAGNDLFRDFRAWQPMDLITISIDEKSEGKKDADTEVKQKTSIELAISKLFGLENRAKAANDGPKSGLDPTALVSASTQNDFKGEGSTNRKDSLTGKISAMVVEVLPSGILRIEGQKIIAVNSEEQVMVVSGLVRQRDINSDNDVKSSKIANMRIDYFGKGTVDDAQHGGWAGRLLRRFWPF